jgi:hypothetical protein
MLRYAPIGGPSQFAVVVYAIELDTSVIVATCCALFFSILHRTTELHFRGCVQLFSMRPVARKFSLHDRPDDAPQY